MEAFHNDIKVKKKYLDRVKAHQKADELIRGEYWRSDGKGCAVGCTVHSSDHYAYERELGIPVWLARVEDRIFEGLSKAESKKWPADFLSAITPGQDLNKIKIPFLIFVVETARESFDHKKFTKKLKYIDGILKAFKKDPINMEDLRVARNADDAAAYAAYAAACAAANAAACAAEAAYAAANADAAYAAANAACAAAADSKKTHKKFADKILELIKQYS